MSNFKEIVTKAVVGKGKETFTKEYSIKTNNNPSTILGCWIINHTFEGKKLKDSVKVEGSYDVNIWYSISDNTETDVAKEKITYDLEIPIKTTEDYDGQDEIIIRIIKQPTCIKADIKDGVIDYVVEGTIASEIVGDTKIRVGIDDEIVNDKEETVDEEIDEEVKEDFIK